MPFDAYSIFSDNAFTGNGSTAFGLDRFLTAVSQPGTASGDGLGDTSGCGCSSDGGCHYHADKYAAADGGGEGGGREGQGPLNATDIAGDTTTTATIEVGGEESSLLDEEGDRDWFAVTLEAGQAYMITLNGSGDPALSDPLVRIYDANGNELAFNDDGGPGLNSALRFTAEVTGTFYVEAAAWDDSAAGNYTIGVQETEPLGEFSIGEIADFLTSGYWESTGRTLRRFADEEISYDISGLTAAAQTLALRAMDAFADATSLTFVAVAVGATADIVWDDEDDGAYATSDVIGEFIIQSEINISSEWNSGNTDLESYTYQTFIHELGHAVGLGHAGPYNSSADYGSDAIYLNDSWATTMMSYFPQNEAGVGDFSYVLGLQQADIAALHLLYAPATGGTNAGDTVYGWNATATGSVFDVSQFDRAPALTLYDTGGTDTLDASGYTQDQRISLLAGTWSDIGGIDNAWAIHEGTLIENAVGGAGNDIFTGNSANNVFDGGAGLDIIDLSSAASGLDFNLSAGNTVTLAGMGTDTLISVEGVIGTAFDDSLIGNTADNYFMGGAGDDTVNGGSGTDILSLRGATEGLVITSGMTGSGTITLGGIGTDTYTSIEGFEGTDFADTFQGSAGRDVFWGGGGNDGFVVTGGGDELRGGEGIDTIDFSNGTSRIWINMIDQSNQEMSSTGGFGDLTVAGMENVIGTAFDDTIGGTSGANVIRSGAGDDLVYAQQGNDLLFGGEGSDELRGWSGNDELHGERGSDELLGQAGNDRLFGGDASTLTETEGAVYRLYNAALGRDPDVPGLADWVSQLASGQTELSGIAAGFIQSAEFARLYGDDVSDADFVELLYQNVLGRPSDAVGRENWLNELASGTSRSDVLIGFSESQEHQESTVLESLVWATDVLEGDLLASVFRMYKSAFDREPDEAGFVNWAYNIQQSGLSVLDMAEGFITAPEFIQRYGENVTDEEFVELLYQNVLGRGSDAIGMADWLDRLANGTSRAEVIVGFSNSPEHITQTAGDVAAFLSSNDFGWSDILDGGEGDDVMIGGWGSDTFRFQSENAGNDVVWGLQAHDKLFIDGVSGAGLGFADFLSTTDEGVVFSRDGLSITFVGADFDTVVAAYTNGLGAGAARDPSAFEDEDAGPADGLPGTPVGEAAALAALFADEGADDAILWIQPAEAAEAAAAAPAVDRVSEPLGSDVSREADALPGANAADTADRLDEAANPLSLGASRTEWQDDVLVLLHE